MASSSNKGRTSKGKKSRRYEVRRHDNSKASQARECKAISVTTRQIGRREIEEGRAE